MNKWMKTFFRRPTILINIISFTPITVDTLTPVELSSHDKLYFIKDIRPLSCRNHGRERTINRQLPHRGRCNYLLLCAVVVEEEGWLTWSRAGHKHWWRLSVWRLVRLVNVLGFLWSASNNALFRVGSASYQTSINSSIKNYKWVRILYYLPRPALDVSLCFFCPYR